MRVLLLLLLVIGLSVSCTLGQEFLCGFGLANTGASVSSSPAILAGCVTGPCNETIVFTHIRACYIVGIPIVEFDDGGLHPVICPPEG